MFEVIYSIERGSFKWFFVCWKKAFIFTYSMSIKFLVFLKYNNNNNNNKIDESCSYIEFSIFVIEFLDI